MALGDDLRATKYLPLKLKGPARHWLNSVPENSIGSWEDLEEAFLDNFQGTLLTNQPITPTETIGFSNRPTS